MTLNTIETLLFDLGKLVFVAYFMLFVLAVLFERKVSSLVISLMVLAVANGVMTAITPILFDVASKPEMFYKFLWYAVFVFLDFVAIFLLYKFHRMLRQSVGRIAHCVGVAFLLLASIQTLRFFDRFVSNTELFQILYQYGIPLINVVLVPVIVLMWGFNVKAEIKKARVVSA
ncbi:hypothetical protein MN202_13080 [Rheinheimera muenzenbergensis]|uniref:Intracellular septation protein A n=1 Tax=Rheinheimera muenzenbergensis TaxID=1193628 RepID=A0ABU8C8S7_9GAMM